jgi:hypothetical protein
MEPPAIAPEVIPWLLTGDPSVRYQTLRDLIGADAESINSEQVRISREGWGASLLALQDPEGTWAGGLYTPKWTSTFYTLLLLKNLGILPNAQVTKACKIILDKGYYKDHGINLWRSMNYSEVCVTGMFVSILSHFGFKDPRLDGMVGFLLDHQMNDGGWNCQVFNGAVHSSFHTTLCVLEGLWEHEKFSKMQNRGASFLARQRGMDFLLEHRLFWSHRTGKIVNSNMTTFHFPAHWKYDVMRALDYARDANCEKDPRFRDAIELLEKRKLQDGRWKLPARHPGKIFFELEKAGESSRWNTLRALRIMKWFKL